MKAIAIDGPAGVGKSTVAKELAKKLNFLHIDTGALYRAMALYVLKEKISLKLTPKDLEKIKIDLKFYKNEQIVLLNNTEVTQYLRSEDVSGLASKISKKKEVRDFLLKIERNLVLKNNVVMDGRDIGTVVLPDANLKIFLTASPDIRAKRRYLELKNKGDTSCTYSEILKNILERDESDTNRAIAPLCPAPDAILLDVGNMKPNEVVETVLKLYKKIS